MIRNTPYGKRIQSKLQREQLDLVNANGVGHFAAGPNAAYGQQQAMMASLALANPAALNGQHVQARHIGHPASAGQLADVAIYGARGAIYQNGVPAAGLHGQHNGHAQQPLHMHNQRQHQPGLNSVDGYVLQGGVPLGSASSFGNLNVGGFTNGMPVPAVASFGGSIGLNDPYQRTTYGYGL